MTRTPLFCTAAAAFELAAERHVRALKAGLYEESDLLWLVPSWAPPQDEQPGEKPEQDLKLPIEVPTEILGANHEQCKLWVEEYGGKSRWVSSRTFAIFDERTANDSTIQIWYNSGYHDPEDYPGFDFPGFPRGWQMFRIPVEKADVFTVNFDFYEPYASWPSFFGKKEELTNSEGVFDVVRAEYLCKHWGVNGEGTVEYDSD